MGERLAPKLPLDASRGFYFDERERTAAEILQTDRLGAQCRGLLLASEVAHLKSDVAWLREHTAALNGELAWRDEAIDRLQREKQEVLDSHTYAVGRRVMAVPCAIKDVLSKKESG